MLDMNIQESELRQRAMQSSHLTEVLAIEQHSQAMPWARLSFEESLNRGDPCRVVLHEEKVLAFHVCSLVVDELHILNLAVAKSAQGIGLGHFLMRDIIGLAKEYGASKVFLEVRVSNEIAKTLYQKWQFEQIAIREKYYRTPDKQREDALVFVRRLNN